MFSLAILIGIYSYIILSVGFLGILYPGVIFTTTALFITAILFLKRKEIMKIGINKIAKHSTINNLLALFVFLFLTQALINLIGVLGPEIAFDALWYHLTFPKLYLENHSIFYVPGGLLYYSAMPKLIEMLYLPVIALNGEMMAKFIHFGFGILSSLAVYSLSRKFFDQKLSMLGVIIFYANLVVAWQSVTAYIDLGRTFFEIMALWGFLNWWEKGERKWLIESSVMLGLAISTKLLAIGSILIFSVLIINKCIKTGFKPLIGNLGLYWLTSFLIASPWFIFSFINTGNPFYPLFSNAINVGISLDPKDLWILFTGLADPISPLYVIFLPLALIFFKKLQNWEKIIITYSVLAIFVWFLTPRTGGGRFILPYLPALSILSVIAINRLKNNSYLWKLCLTLVIFFSIFSIVYRAAANSKYIPVILGNQSKSEFLAKNLNFNYGDFYDTDGYFKKNIKKEDKVLLYGFHNLYYVDFPFIDSSWVKKGERFNYIAVQNGILPQRFKYFNLVYQNKLTNVKLYSIGGEEWIY